MAEGHEGGQPSTYIHAAPEYSAPGHGCTFHGQPVGATHCPLCNACQQSLPMPGSQRASQKVSVLCCQLAR